MTEGDMSGREFVRDSSSNGLKLEIRLTFVGFFATGKHSIIQQWVLADTCRSLVVFAHKNMCAYLML